MKRSWRNLPFFWKVYAGAVALICVVVLLAEFAEDFIPYMVNEREENVAVLEQWLDIYEQAEPGERGLLLQSMRKEAIWFVDLPGGVHEGLAVPGVPESPARRPILDILPESDDWENDWTIVDRTTADGRLLAAGIPELSYLDALEGVMWFAVIALFAGVCCYCFSLFITSRLSRIVGAAQSLARGNLTARVPDADPDGDEIALLACSFNAMAKNIESLVENERRLLYDISHELRSPLARMRLALDLARRSPAGQAEEYFTLADSDMERMSVMVEGIIEQGRSSPVLKELAEELDVLELLRGVAGMVNFEFAGGRSNAGCVLNCALGFPVRLRGARILLEQAFYNVLSNGMRYNPPGGSVEMNISARQPEGGREEGGNNLELVVEIRDFGPGVPEESLDKLFRPFYRVETARDELSGGVGLGLSLARNYLKRHDGVINARNAHPGLLVSIMLPVFRAGA